MRTRIWNNVTNTKFKAIYSRRCSGLAGRCGRTYSFFLSLASAGSVAAWAIWNQHPNVWASIVAFAQVLHVAKPYIPFLGQEKDFLSMSFDYEQLHLLYEQFWFDFEQERISEKDAEALYYKYREKELEMDRGYKSTTCPELGFLMKKSRADTGKALALNFNIGE